MALWTKAHTVGQGLTEQDQGHTKLTARRNLSHSICRSSIWHMYSHPGPREGRRITPRTKPSSWGGRGEKSGRRSRPKAIMRRTYHDSEMGVMSHSVGPDDAGPLASVVWSLRQLTVADRELRRRPFVRLTTTGVGVAAKARWILSRVCQDSIWPSVIDAADHPRTPYHTPAGSSDDSGQGWVTW